MSFVLPVIASASEAIHRSMLAERSIAASLQRKIALQFCRELLAMTIWRETSRLPDVDASSIIEL
jgi:hypothetical protein